MTVIAEMSPEWAPASALAADAGAAVVSPDILPSATVAALFDLPSLGAITNQPQIHLATTSAGSDWKPVSFEIEAAGNSFLIPFAAKRSVLGEAITKLRPGVPFLLDLVASLEVELVDHSGWLVSCDDDALVAGANLAALGDELIQFGRAEALGSGRFRLSRLLRGRRGTEWASELHQVGEPFLILASGTIQTVDLPAAAIGGPVTALPLGIADAGAARAEKLFSAEALRPPSPVHLSVIKDIEGGLSLSWERRSRLGWEWLDGIDAPLGEAKELYRVELRSSSGAIIIETIDPHVRIPSSELVPLSSGPVTISASQIGDRAASRSAVAEITLP